MGLVLNTFKTSEGSNNPMHMHSLARAFAVHIHLNILVDLLVMIKKRRPHSFAVHVLGMILHLCNKYYYLMESSKR